MAAIQDWREALWCLLRTWLASQTQALLLEDPALLLLEPIPYHQCMGFHCSWIKSGGPVGNKSVPCASDSRKEQDMAASSPCLGRSFRGLAASSETQNSFSSQSYPYPLHFPRCLP